MIEKKSKKRATESNDDDDDNDDYGFLYREADDYEIFHCMNSIDDLVGGLVLCHTPLWDAYINFRTKHSSANERRLKTLWNLIDRCQIFSTSPGAGALVQFAVEMKEKKVRDGRKEYLKICDWATDNDILKVESSSNDA